MENEPEETPAAGKGAELLLRDPVFTAGLLFQQMDSAALSCWLTFFKELRRQYPSPTVSILRHQLPPELRSLVGGDGWEKLLDVLIRRQGEQAGFAAIEFLANESAKEKLREAAYVPPPDTGNRSAEIVAVARQLDDLACTYISNFLTILAKENPTLTALTNAIRHHSISQDRVGEFRGILDILKRYERIGESAGFAEFERDWRTYVRTRSTAAQGYQPKASGCMSSIVLTSLIALVPFVALLVGWLKKTP
jgi:hypothetical protein